MTPVTGAPSIVTIAARATTGVITSHATANKNGIGDLFIVKTSTSTE
jgi:hypothetical protein